MTGHGGDIYAAAKELNMAEEKMIDFSASINPLGVPKSALKAIAKNSKYLFNYPDPDAGELKQSLSKYHRISRDSILCGNGSTELIYLIARALRPETVLLPHPTFSEYEKACRTASSKFKIQNLKLGQQDDFEIETDSFIKAMKGCDMAFLCNPNNPTGRLLDGGSVIKIASAAKKAKCCLVVDEAFVDFCPGNSVIGEVKNNSYLIVLRSMTKIYALSGLRIGFGIFPDRVIEELSFHKEPWTVNALAQKAGVAALNDKEYVIKTLRLIKREKKFLEDGFRKIGVRFFHSDANFYLLKIKNAAEVAGSLKRKGILVRDCSNFRGLNNSYMRVAVKSRKDNAFLIKEIKAALQLKGRYLRGIP